MYFQTLLRVLPLLMATGIASAHPPPVFVVASDNPYADDGLARLEQIYRSAGKVTFLAHLGDLKSGTRLCDLKGYQTMAALFREQLPPLVYSPGDNDWTDCRRAVAGDFDPQERLARLREIFYADPTVLRLDKLHVHRPVDLAADYPELFWFRYGHVLFINWHVVGSSNNRMPDDPAAMAEFQARSQANARITAAALKGYKGYLRALVILAHGNMALEQQTPPPAYQPLHQLLEQVLAQTKAPVLVIHGDDHTYFSDKPWQGRPHGERLWRLDLPGFPQVAGVKVEFVKDKQAPFRFTYLDSSPPAEDEGRPLE